MQHTPKFQHVFPYQCQLLTFLASALSSTIHRGSPSPHLAILSKKKHTKSNYAGNTSTRPSFPDPVPSEFRVFPKLKCAKCIMGQYILEPSLRSFCFSKQSAFLQHGGRERSSRSERQNGRTCDRKRGMRRGRKR